jgi:hypothetical protein
MPLLCGDEVKFMERGKCEICDDAISYEWTDLHGEAICWRCGTPYQLYQYDENKKRIPDAEPTINIKDEYIPMLKQYWNENKKHMGLGTYLGKPKYPEKHHAFFDWLDTQEVPAAT